MLLSSCFKSARAWEWGGALEGAPARLLVIGVVVVAPRSHASFFVGAREGAEIVGPVGEGSGYFVRVAEAVEEVANLDLLGERDDGVAVERRDGARVDFEACARSLGSFEPPLQRSRAQKK